MLILRTDPFRIEGDAENSNGLAYVELLHHLVEPSAIDGRSESPRPC